MEASEALLAISLHGALSGWALCLPNGGVLTGGHVRGTTAIDESTSNDVDDGSNNRRVDDHGLHGG